MYLIDRSIDDDMVVVFRNTDEPDPPALGYTIYNSKSYRSFAWLLLTQRWSKFMPTIGICSDCATGNFLLNLHSQVSHSNTGVGIQFYWNTMLKLQTEQVTMNRCCNSTCVNMLSKTNHGMEFMKSIFERSWNIWWIVRCLQGWWIVRCLQGWWRWGNSRHHRTVRKKDTGNEELKWVNSNERTLIACMRR